MRELFLAKLKDLGVDSSKFGLHSLRAGGASAAANAGVAGWRGGGPLVQAAWPMAIGIS